MEKQSLKTVFDFLFRRPPKATSKKWDSMSVKLTFSKAEKSLSRSEDTKFSIDHDDPRGWGGFGSYRMSGLETAQAWGPIALEKVCKTASREYIMGSTSLVRLTSLSRKKKAKICFIIVFSRPPPTPTAPSASASSTPPAS